MRLGLLAFALLAAACSDGRPPPVAAGIPAADPPQRALPPDTCPKLDAGDVAYDTELAAIDLSAAPESLDLTDLTEFDRATVGYMLEIPIDELAATLDRDQLLGEGFMASAIVAAFAGGDVDLALLRRGLVRYHTCYRRAPATLDEFTSSIYDYTQLAAESIPSEPKLGERWVYKDLDALIFVAETVKDSAAHETEMLIGKARADGNFDFLAYDGAGKLSKSSSFAVNSEIEETIRAPIACMQCHFDRDKRTFTVLEPHEGD